MFYHFQIVPAIGKAEIKMYTHIHMRHLGNVIFFFKFFVLNCFLFFRTKRSYN